MSKKKLRAEANEYSDDSFSNFHYDSFFKDAKHVEVQRMLRCMHAEVSFEPFSRMQSVLRWFYG